MTRAAALLALLLLAACTPAARADGDPASDVLIADRVFYPYQMKLPRSSTSELRETIADATEQGIRVRVALIAHDFDLGSAGLLFRKPQAYARFLAEELGNFNRDWLLVVMPNGYGLYHCVPKRRAGGYSDPCEGTLHKVADERALASLPSPERSKQDFAEAGALAVRRLAEQHGARFGPSPLLLVAGGVALLAAGAGALLLLRRRRSRV